MTRLNKSMRTSVKRGNSIPATITDIHGTRATARLAGNGAVYRSLKVVGGPVVVGQSVNVDFTTAEPTIVAPGIAAQATATAPGKRASARPIREEEIPLASGRPSLDLIWVTSAGGLVIGSTAGYPATATGLQNAINFVTGNKSYTIWIPICTISGNFTFPDYTEIRGVDPTRTIITGMSSIGHACSVRDLKFTMSATNSSSDYVVCISTQGDVTFENVIWDVINTGTAKATGLTNGEYSANWRIQNCKFVSNGVGIRTNGIRDGYGGNFASAKFKFYGMEGGIDPGWNCFIDTEDQNWLKFTARTGFQTDEYIYDGFILELKCRPYAKSGSKIVLSFITDKEDEFGTLEIPWNNLSEKGLKIEDGSWADDYAANVGQETLLPPIPFEDEDFVETVNGASTWSNYGRGDVLGWIWENQEYGIGSDTTGGSTGEQTPWTSGNPGDSKVVYAWLVRGMGAKASDTRLDQDGYDLWLKLDQCYALLGDGSKVWIAPTVVNISLVNTTFDCDVKSIDAGPYTKCGTDGITGATTGDATGVVMPEEEFSQPAIGPSLPTVTWGGMSWYDTNP